MTDSALVGVSGLLRFVANQAAGGSSDRSFAVCVHVAGLLLKLLLILVDFLTEIFRQFFGCASLAPVRCIPMR